MSGRTMRGLGFLYLLAAFEGGVWKMKATVDENLCSGCGLCVDTCPDVFELPGDVAVVKADPVPADAEECAEQAAEECPVEAISVA
jgi:ferredoxin